MTQYSLDLLSEDPAYGVAPEEALEREELKRDVGAAILGLPPLLRQVAILRFGIDGEASPVAMVAQRLGFSRTYAYRLINDVKNQLRDRLRTHIEA